MDNRKIILPKNKNSEPLSEEFRREYIFFKASFNNFRDVGNFTANEVLDREEWAECEAVLCLPDSYSSNGEKTPLILACHGAGNTVSEEKEQVGGIPNVIDCIKAGYAALDISGSAPHGLTLGCPEHIFALYKAYRHVVKNYNLSERVLIHGTSMGGQTALNFANVYPSIVLAIGLFNPGLNLSGVTVGNHSCRNPWDRVMGNGQQVWRERIKRYFRFPSDEWCEKNTVGFNPYRNRSFINSDGERVTIPPCPVKIWQGADDMTVDPIMSREYIDSIKRAGCYAELHIIEGVKHAATATMRKEIAIWFNRFI